GRTVGVDEDPAAEAAGAGARTGSSAKTDRVVRDRRVDERAGTSPDCHRAAVAPGSALAALTAPATQVADQRAVDQVQHAECAEHSASPAAWTALAGWSWIRRACPAASTAPAGPGSVFGDERPGHDERAPVVDSAPR